MCKAVFAFSASANAVAPASLMPLSGITSATCGVERSITGGRGTAQLWHVGLALRMGIGEVGERDIALGRP